MMFDSVVLLLDTFHTMYFWTIEDKLCRIVIQLELRPKSFYKQLFL